MVSRCSKSPLRGPVLVVLVLVATTGAQFNPDFSALHWHGLGTAQVQVHLQ